MLSITFANQVKTVFVVLILFWSILTASSTEADHFTNEKYKEYNQALLDQMWAERLPEIQSSQKSKTKRVFYTGFALWGGEQWSIGDAKKVGSALETFYDDRKFFSFIFSNNENDFLPDKYPTVFADMVLEHTNRLQNLTGENDLIIFGLYSHGLKEKLILRLGTGAERTLFVDELKQTLEPLKPKNVLLIISACYSGSFITKLKSDKIAIATASAADKQSNGCSPLHNQTFFGKNFVDTLSTLSSSEGASILTAIKLNSDRIQKQEKWKTKSDPQLFVGEKFSIDR